MLIAIIILSIIAIVAFSLPIILCDEEIDELEARIYALEKTLTAERHKNMEL